MANCSARIICYSIGLLLWSTSAQAAEYVFRSKLDVFNVDVTAEGATYEGRTVSLEPFVFISPLFKAELSDSCDGVKGKPDLTITRKIGDKEIKRTIYFEQKIIGDGQNCGSIEGHGLFQLPLHRNWFDGKSQLKIALGDEFSIWKDNRQVVAFKKVNGKWQNKDPLFFTNWSFFEKFTSAVVDFPVDFRVHPAAAKESTQFQMRQPGRVFNFYKVGEKTWAIQFPDVPWLAASGNFGVFDNMDQKVWISDSDQVLRIVKDKSANRDDRIKSIRTLYDNSSPDVRDALRGVLTSEDDQEVKKEIVTLLRKRPSDENFKILVLGLSSTQDIDLQNFITKALRVRNPKGPVVDVNDNDEMVAKKISEWKTWVKSLK